MLVGEDHREPEAPGLGEHLFEASRQVEEVLALVDVERGVDPSGLSEPGAMRRGLQTLATTKLPRRRAVSSPRTPFGIRTRQMPPSSTSPISKLDSGRPTTWRTKSPAKRPAACSSPVR